MEQNKVNYSIKRIGGYLHKVSTIIDSTGEIISTISTPFMIELKPRDILQIIVGATVLAVPVGLTEETWILAEQLKLLNVVLLGALSILFTSLFIYYNFYRFHFKKNVFEYIKRVIATYGLSVITVAILLTLIEKCPWDTNSLLAIKRIIITAFPASMAATISDNIK